MVYVYNSDEYDGPYGYGETPPAWGVQILRGLPVLPNGRDDDRDGAADEPGERVGLSSAPRVLKSPLHWGDPQSPSAVVHVQRGLLANGARMVEYGSGVSSLEAVW